MYGVPRNGTESVDLGSFPILPVWLNRSFLLCRVMKNFKCWVGTEIDLIFLKRLNVL